MEKKLIKDFENIIEESGTQIEEEGWSPVFGGDIDEDDNSKFLINGKVAQGKRNEEVEEQLKEEFNKGYK